MRVLAALVAFCFTAAAPPRNPSGPKPKADLELPTAPYEKPVASCAPGKKCIVAYRLNEEINEQSAKTVIDWISAAEDAHADAFMLEMNTPGGEVDQGFEIAKKIENSKIPITCVVDGMSASMGAYILQSCPTRVVTRRSVIMFHEPSLGGLFAGRQFDWTAIAERMRVMTNAMAEHCVHRMAISLKEYHARTDGGKQFWMDEKDALKFKAVDKVVWSVQEVLASL